MKKWFVHSLRIVRPDHWIKNVFVFAALIFSGRFYGPFAEAIQAWGACIGAFVSFCLASSTGYIFNDIVDREADRHHPYKCLRPLAAGEISIRTVVGVAGFCVLMALSCAWFLSRSLFIVLVAYLLLMMLYSVYFKKIMILDCILIALGFCLRAVGGAVVLDVMISPWLVICTFSLSLFLAFGKRYSELVQLGAFGETCRYALASYTPELLSHMLNIAGSLTLVCFLLYTTNEQTRTLFNHAHLVYSSPFVLYCVCRCSALIQKGQFSDPVWVILQDRPFQVGFLGWLICCIAVILWNR